MAKKTSSSIKKPGKKVAAIKSKAPVKKAAKLAPKPVASKSGKKTAAKSDKAETAKALKKVAPLASVKAKDATQKKTVEKNIEKMLNKKSVKPVASELVSEEQISSEDSITQKAEKVGKVKPIRIEKGNPADEKAKWIELSKKQSKEKAQPYKMSDTFSALTPIQHKVLGWGFILSNDNDRLEVLFESGIRMLISNYKS